MIELESKTKITLLLYSFCDPPQDYSSAASHESALVKEAVQ
jgi:hypothetical protein